MFPASRQRIDNLVEGFESMEVYNGWDIYNILSRVDSFCNSQLDEQQETKASHTDAKHNHTHTHTHTHTHSHTDSCVPDPLLSLKLLSKKIIDAKQQLKYMCADKRTK